MKRKPQDFFVKPATQAFIREARRTPGYSLSDFLHGYIYGRWPYLYIGIGTGEHPLVKKYGAAFNRLARIFSRQRERGNGDAVNVDIQGDIESGTFADGYHGKVVPLESATRLVTVNEEIALPDLEQVIPYKRARDIVLRNPDHIMVLECPCRAARPDPCLPLDVCLIVGEPFASFIMEHHPDRAREVSQAEAVAILQAEDERGHVHHAFFKDAMFGRFYAICNCCSCCCGAMQTQRNGIPMLISSGYISQVDENLCIGCGECETTCQFEALSILDGLVVVDEELCMGCGVCTNKCIQGALSLRRDPSKGEPLEICELMTSAGRLQ